MLCPCLIILHLVVLNKCQSEAPKAVDFVVDVVVVVILVVNVVVVALLVIVHIISSCGQSMLI